jgi:hypothetical protein
MGTPKPKSQRRRPARQAAVEGAQAMQAEYMAGWHAARGGQAGYRQPSHSTPATTRSAAKRKAGGS